MRNFPLDKYKYYFSKEKGEVIAVSTYAGKTVKGIAKVHPDDKYNEEYGKELAAARCNYKIAKKRAKNAERELKEITELYNWVSKEFKSTQDYRADSNKTLADAYNKLKSLENA